MLLRFSVGAAPALGGATEKEVWQVVEVPCSGGDVTIGRQPGAGVELPFAAVSARHARVFREAGGYRVEDLGSANGTTLGGRKLVARRPLPLAPAEVIECAGIRIRFDGELPEPQHPSEPEGTGTLARRLVHDVFSACPPEEAARLIGVAGPGAGLELGLFASERALVVGRGETCDLVLPDEDVSREHAAFQRTAAGISVHDLQSKNGVEVEGQKLVGSRVLRDGDSIRIGETTLRLVDPEDRYLRKMQEAGGKPESDTCSPAAGVTQVGRQAPAPVTVSKPPASTAADSDKATDRRGAAVRLPVLAGAVAVVVLLLVVGLVLALAFGCQV